jgi:hypothetical protein
MSLLLHADDVLRGRHWKRAPDALNPSLRFLLMILCFGLAYGAAMGCFGGVSGDRVWQVVYSAVKVPMLLLVTFAVSLPSFFVLNTLLGVRADFGDVLRGLFATQAALTILLSSFAPLTLFFYVCFNDYQAAILFNVLMFAIASIAAQRLLRRHYRPLIARNSVHRRLFYVWIVIFAFVGIQMGWVLRPFVGSPDKPVQFFREGAWGNAYVEVVHIGWRFVIR